MSSSTLSQEENTSPDLDPVISDDLIPAAWFLAPAPTNNQQGPLTAENVQALIPAQFG